MNFSTWMSGSSEAGTEVSAAISTEGAAEIGFRQLFAGIGEEFLGGGKFVVLADVKKELFGLAVARVNE